MMKKDSVSKSDLGALLVQVTEHPECPPTLQERIYDALSTAAHVADLYSDPCCVRVYLDALSRYDAGRMARV